jgi:hypothetical protein
MSHVQRFCDWRLGAGWQLRPKAAAAKAATTGSTAAAELGSPGGSAGSETAAVVDVQAHGRCTIYLATDEPAGVKEIERKYQHIRVITNKVALDTGEAHTVVRNCKISTGFLVRMRSQYWQPFIIFIMWAVTIWCNPWDPSQPSITGWCMPKSCLR